MKKAILLLTLLLSTHSIFGMDGEIWFYIDDNTPNVSYYVKAVRISNNDPLFGANFLEVDTYNYNVVISDYDAVYQEPVGEFEKLRGFNFLRDIGAFPAIGEGKIRFEIYRNNVLIFKFSIDLVHVGLPPNGTPDLTFEYSYLNPNVILAKANNITTQISNNSFVNTWDLQGETRNITPYLNQVTLTNLIAGSVESNIKTTFNTAPMGFPYNNVQLGVQYNPGTTVSLWRGVYYNISASHTSYVKNGVNYNFRNWNEPYSTNYSSSTSHKIQPNTSEFRSMYYQTQPLTVFNNLEGGSTNNNYNIIWLNPNPDITTGWQFGSAFNLFNYSQNSDEYNIEAPSTFQNLNTTWWFYKWNDGSTNRLKQNLQATSPTNLTAYYKGNLRSNDQNGISSNSQRKMVRTDNGIYHLVYESMGNVYYTHSLTSNFDGSWAQEELLRTNAKNPAIEYHVNNVKIVFEFYDPVYGDDAIIYLSAYAPNASGVYTQVVNECEEVANFPVSYFGNAKPVISYNQVQLFIAYRKNSTEGLKERTKWLNINTGLWNWSSEAAIPGTNLYSINPSVVESYAHIHLVYESQNSIMYKYAVTESYAGPWQYEAAINVSTGSGFTKNNYPNISISNGLQTYLLVSWLGAYNNTQSKIIAKENDYGLKREAVVVKAGYNNSWGGSTNFSNNVNFTNNNSINSSPGSIITWSESNGLYSKFVKRNSNGTYSTIANLSTSGIQTMVSNGSSFDNIKVMVFNTSTAAPYLLNKCTNNFVQGGLSKIGETEIAEISYGRAGVVEKNGMEFLFNIGDVSLNGQTIQFIERIDTLPVNSLEELNEFARTESFNLNSQSELIFSNYYYVVNPSLADSVLTDIFNVNFKCELVNSATNQVIGTFDNITYNKSNVDEYNNIGYLVDCSGIESGDYFLRLFTTVSEDGNLFISDFQRDDIHLEKSNLIKRNFKGEGLPTTYELAQNYPNPFNPSTTIKYQLPKDGIVTLKVYDILGSEVATLVNEQKTAGRYEVSFNASQLASGVYIFRLKSGEYVSSKKMMLLK